MPIRRDQEETAAQGEQGPTRRCIRSLLSMCYADKPRRRAPHYSPQRAHLLDCDPLGSRSPAGKARPENGISRGDERCSHVGTNTSRALWYGSFLKPQGYREERGRKPGLSKLSPRAAGAFTHQPGATPRDWGLDVFRGCRSNWSGTREHPTANPKWIPYQSPGLARRAYPGDTAPILGATQKGLRLNGFPLPQPRWG